tara:strand:- start:2386 stop:7236 length:4851 start_codon:yes stop_codon:yes gene_type:complete
MATNKIVFEIDVKSGQLKKATQSIGKNTKAIKDQEKTQKKATKTSGGFDKQNKALYQNNLSGAKSFSKLNQTIGGSGGSGALVASYAVLAANVFAVTAAFNTLRGAAASEKLAEGLVAFSNSSGQSLDVVAKKLQETTGHAVSFDMAMRTAALSTSAGFGVAEMEGLTRVAKGASLALGRDMGDALDRLTRGAIKLEPEILDELGIMVRLDDATENYAATLGKSATQLTRFERQQAFMNAIISEGETKFGAIADSIDPNSYDKLSAAFEDLSKVVLNMLNGALIPLINFMISSPGIFLGAVAMFSGGIAKRMIPALGDMSKRSLDTAKAAQSAVAGTLKSSEAAAAGAMASIGPIDGLDSKYNGLVKTFKKGEGTTKDLTNMKRSLTVSIKSLTKKIEDETKINGKATRGDKKRLGIMVKQRTSLDLLRAGKVKDVGMLKLELDLSNAYVQAKTRESEVIALAGTQVYTYREAMSLSFAVLKQATLATYEYAVAQFTAIKSTKALGFFSKALRMGLGLLKTAFFAAGIGAKAFGTALLNMVPFIGQIILMASFAIDILKGMLKWFGIGTDEQKAYQDSMEDLTTVLDGIPDKMKELTKQQERAGHSTQLMINKYKVLGGLLKTVMDTAIEAEKASEEAGNFEGRGGREIGAGIAGNYEIAPGVDVGKSREAVLANMEEVSPVITALRRLNKDSEQFARMAKDKLGVSLDDFMLSLSNTGVSIRGISQIMQTVGIDIEDAMDGISQATAGMSTNFSEAEKVTQKFFRGMVKATKFDDISSQFKTLSNDLNSVIKEAKEAGEDPLDFLGEAALKMGAGMTQLLGAGAVKEVAKVAEIGAEIAEKQLDLARTTNKEKREALVEEIKTLQGKYTAANKKVGKVIQDQVPVVTGLLNNLVTRTRLTEKHNKFLETQKKNMLQIAKNEFTILAAKKMEDAQNKARIRLIELEMQLKEGAVERAKQAQIANLQLSDEQVEALGNEKALLSEIETLTNNISENSVNIVEAKLAGLVADEKALKNQQELNKAVTSNSAKLAKVLALSSTGEQSKIEAANAEITVSEQTYNLAVQTALMRMEVVKAEFSLLEAQNAVETARNTAKIAELKTELIDETARQTRIAQLQKKQKDAGKIGPHRGGGIKASLTEEENTELTRLLSESNPDIQNSIAGLQAINTALEKTYTVQLDALEITAARSAQTIIGAALDAEIAVKNSLGDLGEGFLQNNAAAGMASAITTALGPSMLSKVKDDMATKIAELTEKKTNDPENFTVADTTQLTEFQNAYDELVERTKGKNFELANSFANMASMISGMFGEDGAMISGMFSLSATMLTSFDNMKSGFDELKDKGDKATNEDKLKAYAGALEGIGNIMGQLGALSAASAKQKVAGVDKEIAAEKKKDGKSKESLAKIQALEKKKEAIERKAFERNKKIQMAQIIVNTAAGIMKTIGETGFFGLPLALIIGAMGAAQLSMVAGTSYQGGGSAATVSAPSSIEVGKRDNKVDVSKGASAGETAYLRGGTGLGTNANSFRPGAAAGMKSYASGGDVLVGERGPEVISPLSPFEVTPNDKIGGTSNVNFTINAVDAAGVQELLQTQRGNIIGMIREAAHEHGEEFMEPVNVEAY